MPNNNWIQNAVKSKSKGGLHKSLGIPEGQDIPPSTLAQAAKRPGKVGQQARLAQTLKGLKKKK